MNSHLAIWFLGTLYGSLSVLYQVYPHWSTMTPLALLSTNPLQAIALIFVIILAITFHEFAHAWTADRLGDDTPALQGRVTLNPLAHLDPVGSIAFLLVGFGWGKPVIYNPMRLSRKTDELLVALAGPASNILLAIALNVLNQFGVFNSEIISPAVYINVILAAFNMIPIPPLDGSAIVAYFWPEYRSVMGGQLGLIILLLLIFSGTLGAIVTPIAAVFSHITTLFGLLN